MIEFIGTFALAFVLGFALSRILRWLIPIRGYARMAIHVLIPPGVLFGVFLVFFEGAPIGEDWIWLGVGFVYFWPWYLAWGVGGIVEKFARLSGKQAGAKQHS